MTGVLVAPGVSRNMDSLSTVFSRTLDFDSRDAAPGH